MLNKLNYNSRAIPPKKKTGQDEEASRKSCRLAKKSCKDYGEMHSGKKRKSPSPEQDEDTERSGSESEESNESRSNSGAETDSQVEGGSDQGSVCVDGMTPDTEDEDDLDQQIRRQEKSLNTIKEIKKQSQKRIASLEKLLVEKNEIEKMRRKSTTPALRRKEKLKKLARIDDQIEDAASQISKMQQHEDTLASQVQDNFRKEKCRVSTWTKEKEQKEMTSAESTPKTAGEYRNLINELLDVTERSNCADRNAEKIQRLLSRAANVDMNESDLGLVKTKKHKRKREKCVKSESSSDEEDTSPEKRKMKGKLCSGKVAQVDAVDIRRQVKYPHSRLNGAFTRVKSFGGLDLNLFVAGELETILRVESKVEERARLKILLVNMYHAVFLDIEEIKDQYDVCMKMIERDELQWGDDLAGKVDRALDRRSRLNRLRVGNVKTEKPKQKLQNVVVKKEEFIYCNLFNKGTCSETNTHKGKFGSRDNVTLNHACKRCLQEKGVRVGHAEIDPRCPYNVS